MSTQKLKPNPKNANWYRTKNSLPWIVCVGLITIAAVPYVMASPSQDASDSWRRTAQGWEQKEEWNQRILKALPLPALSLRTAPRRCWPAAIAAAEVLFAVWILQFDPQRKGTFDN